VTLFIVVAGFAVDAAGRSGVAAVVGTAGTVAGETDMTALRAVISTETRRAG
jgi:hypothetical protein